MTMVKRNSTGQLYAPHESSTCPAAESSDVSDAVVRLSTGPLIIAWTAASSSARNEINSDDETFAIGHLKATVPSAQQDLPRRQSRAASSKSSSFLPNFSRKIMPFHDTQSHCQITCSGLDKKKREVRPPNATDKSSAARKSDCCELPTRINSAELIKRSYDKRRRRRGCACVMACFRRRWF